MQYPSCNHPLPDTYDSLLRALSAVRCLTCLPKLTYAYSLRTPTYARLSVHACADADGYRTGAAGSVALLIFNFLYLARHQHSRVHGTAAAARRGRHGHHSDAPADGQPAGRWCWCWWC